jgi:hypothetical protein
LDASAPATGGATEAAAGAEGGLEGATFTLAIAVAVGTVSVGALEQAPRSMKSETAEEMRAIISAKLPVFLRKNHRVVWRKIGAFRAPTQWVILSIL